MNRLFSIILTLVLNGFLLTACSLDREYFDPRTTDRYALDFSNVAAANIEEVNFMSNQNTLAGVFLKAVGADATTTTILYFHGDDKDVDKYVPRLDKLYPLSVNIFIFDFQGYGKSEGKPSLAAIKQNAEDALAYLQSRGDVNQDKIVYYTFSLGLIFAAHLIENIEEPAALITENSPSSSNNMVRGTVTVGVPSSFFFNESFNNVPGLKNLSGPYLQFHSLKDGTVPYEKNGDVLYKAAGSNDKEQVLVTGSGHSNLIETLGEAKYRQEIQDFLVSSGL